MGQKGVKTLVVFPNLKTGVKKGVKNAKKYEGNL